MFLQSSECEKQKVSLNKSEVFKMSHLKLLQVVVDMMFLESFDVDISSVAAETLYVLIAFNKVCKQMGSLGFLMSTVSSLNVFIWYCDCFYFLIVCYKIFIWNFVTNLKFEDFFLLRIWRKKKQRRDKIDG